MPGHTVAEQDCGSRDLSPAFLDDFSDMPPLDQPVQHAARDDALRQYVEQEKPDQHESRR
jgi:hypothetical protein